VTDTTDDGGGTFNSTALSLGSNAVFQDYLNLAAAASDGAENAVTSYFAFGGNTYVVADNDDGTSFTNGVDAVVELTGVVDLSTATLVTAANVETLTIA